MNVRMRILALGLIMVVAGLSIILSVSRNNGTDDLSYSDREALDDVVTNLKLSSPRQVVLDQSVVTIDGLDISGANVTFNLSGADSLLIRKEDIKLYDAGHSVVDFQAEEIGLGSSDWSAAYYGLLSSSLTRILCISLLKIPAM
jgi:hypothetical protein